MRKSKAKERILQVANEMFRRVGYSDLNVNEIAHEAGVSIGTLYYHFPDGKTSILMEIRSQIFDNYEKKFEEKLDPKCLRKTSTFNEGLELLLKSLIDIHRKERLVLAAMESEVLRNLVSYDKVAESIVVENLFESDAKPVTGVLKVLLRKHYEEGLTLNGRGAKVSKVIDILIHRFIYIESMFGSEQEFLDMMIKIVRALLF